MDAATMMRENDYCEILLPYEKFGGKFGAIEKTPPQNITAVAIGNFDGLHLGHKKLLDELGETGAIVVILKDSYKLTPFRIREKFSPLPFFYFDLRIIKELDGDGFITLLINQFPNLKKIVVGSDFKFGKDRRYDANFLSDHFNGKTKIMDEFCIDGTGVHTSIIKIFLKNGNLTGVNQFLGRKYEIAGPIIKGQGIGKKDLVATLNLQTGRYFLPKVGVYATFTKIDERIYKSVSFIGNRISTDGEFSVETHIIDKFEDEKAEFAVVYFVKFLRENRKFHDLSDLKNQILTDIANAKNVLENESI